MDAEMIRLWNALNSPYAITLQHVLGDVQKDGFPPGYSDWKDFVSDVMNAMEAQDSGLLDDFMPE